MRNHIFSHRAVAAVVAAGALAALPAAASADSGSTTIYVSAQGSTLFGQLIPVLGTQGWTLTLPVDSQSVPQFVWDSLDFTVSSSIVVDGSEILHLQLDPHMVR